jgi:hypothetical protein
VNKKREWLMLLCTIAIGAILGVISKQGDVATQGTIPGNLLFALGLVTSGFFIWIVVCIIISTQSESATLAAINVFSFLASMLLTYYLYSYYVVGYLIIRVVKFWVVALIPSAALGAVVFNIKTNKLKRRAVLITASLIMLIEMFYLQGALPAAIVIDGIIYAALLIYIKYLK